MTLEDVEVRDTGRDESLGTPNKVNRGLYLAVILILGVVLIVGVIGWFILAWNDKTIPDGLGVILGTVAGGLVALIADPAKR